MKIVIPGGSGQAGTVLARAFHAAQHQVVVLSRRPEPRPWRVLPWDGKSIGDWQKELDGADAVINLAGRIVNCRYTSENQKDILASRIDSTRVVGRAIEQCRQPPKVWLQASTATIYSHRFDAPNDEYSGHIGGNEPDAPAKWKYSVDVAVAWERTLAEAQTPQTRKVAMRTTLMMNADKGSIFDTMLGLVRKGLGGANGSGRQYVSWIHEEDFIRAVEFIMERNGIQGPVNLAAPNPLPNSEFMRDLRQAAGIPFGLPAPEPLLQLGAIFMNTETELVLKSRRVVPGVLSKAGFTFHFPTWAEAAADLCRRANKTGK